MVNSVANVKSITLFKTTADGKQVRLDSSMLDSRAPFGIRAVNPPQPAYPPKKTIAGTVEVEVNLDATGKVTAAKLVSGDKTLQAEVEAAALKTLFEFSKTSNEVVKAKGVLMYVFAPDKSVTVSEYLQILEMEIKPNKYHTSIRALVDRLKSGKTQPGADESSFVSGGKASVTVRLSEMKPEVIEQLKNAGFEVVTEMASANAIVGRMPIEKIQGLADIAAVTFISPQGK